MKVAERCDLYTERVDFLAWVCIKTYLHFSYTCYPIESNKNKSSKSLYFRNVIVKRIQKTKQYKTLHFNKCIVGLNEPLKICSGGQDRYTFNTPGSESRYESDFIANRFHREFTNKFYYCWICDNTISVDVSDGSPNVDKDCDVTFPP